MKSLLQSLPVKNWILPIIDHAQEGVYSTVFCAAVESAAFVVSDLRELIKIGLSYIPEECLTAQAIHLVEECYDAGWDWKQTRFEQETLDIRIYR